MYKNGRIRRVIFGPFYHLRREAAIILKTLQVLPPSPWSSFRENPGAWCVQCTWTDTHTYTQMCTQQLQESSEIINDISDIWSMFTCTSVLWSQAVIGFKAIFSWCHAAVTTIYNICLMKGLIHKYDDYFWSDRTRRPSSAKLFSLVWRHKSHLYRGLWKEISEPGGFKMSLTVRSMWDQSVKSDHVKGSKCKIQEVFSLINKRTVVKGRELAMLTVDQSYVSLPCQWHQQCIHTNHALQSKWRQVAFIVIWAIHR